MKLNKGVKKLLLFLTITGLLMTSVLAQEATEKKALDIEQAVNSAISKDDILAQYSRSIEVYEEQKKAVRDLSSAMYNEKKLLISETEQNKQYRQDVIRKQVTEQYQNIALLQKNIDLLKRQITLSETQVKQAEIKKKKGLVDELIYEKTLQELETIKVTKEQTEKNLEDAKKSFLKSTHLNIEQYTLIVDDTYVPFVLEGNINSYASKMATKLAKYIEERVELSEESFWERVSTAGVGGTAPTYDVYLEQKVALQNAKENADSTYDTYRLLIETKYTALNAQLDAIKAKEEAYRMSVKEMVALEIKYKAGYISTLDYDTRKFNLEAKALEYLKEVYKYNSMKVEIEQPWTMSEYRF